MTNEEAIRYLSQMYLIQFDGREHESLTIAINSIQENSKLKAEIEMYKQLVSEQSDLNIEQFKQIDEQTQAIDNYNKALQSWTDANNNLLRLVGDLKDEIVQFKARIDANNVKKEFKEFCDNRDKEESKLKFREAE